VARLEPSAVGGLFVGSVDLDEDVDAAARLAERCGAYRRDDEDEDPLDGAVNCFGCRYRRWLPDGFSCMQGLLLPVLAGP
jgi:hypothetical protein